MSDKIIKTSGSIDTGGTKNTSSNNQGAYIDDIFKGMPSQIQDTAIDTKELTGEKFIKGITSDSEDLSCRENTDTIGMSLLTSIQLYVNKYYDSVSKSLGGIFESENKNDMPLICEMRNLPAFSNVNLVTVESIIVAYLKNIFVDNPEPLVIDLFVENSSLDTIKSYIKNGISQIIEIQHKILVDRLVEFSQTLDSESIQKYQAVHTHISQNGVLIGFIGFPDGITITEEESDICMGYIHLLQSIEFLVNLNNEVKTWAPSEDDFEKYATIS